ncbi:PilW family protein [Polaromonas sp. CT11-55]|uniref:PilW family protein n=1 Tax=Polaromonas sp. CT11-55 TaxID=3243045 RepID=UPI0039A78850
MKIIRHMVGQGAQRGLTLVELLIALALSLVVLVGLSSVYVAVKQSFRFQETTGRLQEDGAFALDFIAKDLRMAGYAGCPGINKITVGGVTTYYPGSMMTSGSPGGINGPNPLAQIETGNAEVILQPLTSLNFIRGFDNVPSGMFASGAAPSSSGTHSLFFSGGSSNAVSLSALMGSATASPTLTGDPFGWATTTTNSGIYDFIISNCSSSSVFKGKVSISSGVTSVGHGTGLGNAADTFTSSTAFGTDATVMPVVWSFFYVAPGVGTTTPSLYRVFYNGNTRLAAEELVSNVESMRLQYGENTTLDASGAPTLVADVWRTSAADVADWSKVVAVRIGLMMISSEENVNPGVTPVTPTLLGQSYTLPTGASTQRLRKEFSTTVVLRNRVAAR